MMAWTELALWALTVTCLALLAAHALLTRRQLTQLRAQLKERCDTLGRELHATGSGSIGMGHRVVNCERQLHEMRRLLDDMRQNDPLRVSYDEASRLVDLGADIDDLMNTCGISRPEAELVAALRRKKVA